LASKNHKGGHKNSGKGSAPKVQRASVARQGFDPDIPLGGTTTRQSSSSSAISRQQDMDDLYGAYLGCAPANTAIDAIARTITAGGLEISVDTDDHEELHATPTQLPANVQAVQDLLDYVNPDDDIRQLMRNVVVDLMVTGDSFLEVTWMLGVPYALWHLDSATMTPIADEHGTITSYVQDCGPGREVTFKPTEVIHIRFDAPRGGVYGMSPTRKLQAPILTWIWAEALLKETMRKGNPPRFHMAFDQSEDLGEIKRFRQSYSARHLGPTNLGIPLVSKGAKVEEFKTSALAEYLATLDSKRDVIFSGYGVPGRKVGVSEPGSLGGAGAEIGQDKTFRLNTCGPIAELILEKLNFVILGAYGVDGYRLKFGDVDYRDDVALEQLRDLRLRNGSWTINRYRDDIGEPPVDGGDVPILVDRQNLVAWEDLPALSKANLAAAQLAAEPPEPPVVVAPAGAGGPPAAAPQPSAGIPSLPPAVGKSGETVRDLFLAQFEANRRRAEEAFADE
jgi:HK97 family phage portal protein